MIPTAFPETQWMPLAQGQHRYLLLDGAQCDAPKAVLQFLPHAGSRLFDGLLADGSADTSVYLARLPDDLPAQALLLRLAGHANALGAATLIESPLAQDGLLQRLSRRLDARYPNGKEFLARFYDGRVLPWWVQALDPAQRDAFLALGERWHFVTHDHRWDSLALTCPALDPHALPWTLETEQRRVLIDSSYPYTLIEHYQLTDPELLDRLPSANWYRFLRGAVDLAARHGIEDSRRVVMVCTWALLVGDDLAHDPAWQVRLQAFAEGRRTARQIGDEVWPMEETW
ncbi:DUF4123 domain-containing protein [Bacillus subtilis subsp. subtilis]|nr:DUF4123 domain-containing protein [Bacillus subtilis subsp. subtilis]